jgi:3-oxoacyl-[acyl-carrier protein] reductase
MTPFYRTEEGKALHWTEELPEQEWDANLALNLTAPFYCCKHVIPAMKRQGSGRIVNFSSIAQEAGRPDGTFAYAAYAAAKAGVTGLTRQLAVELGSFGIAVNCVCPGSVLSERMVERYTNDPVWKETSERHLRQTTPLGRAGTTDELAAAVLYLASDDSSYVTGVTLDVNGGRYMR